MYKALNTGAIGVTVASLEEGIALAAQYGYAGLEFSIEEVARLCDGHGANYVRELFGKSNILPAGFGLPTDWRGDEAKWQEGLRELPRLAKASSAIGATRTATWIMPCSNDRDWEENLAFHIARFKPIAQILNDEGIRLGLEFIGPKTIRDNSRFPFIHTLQGMLGMAAEIGSNVGLLLDCWHWYTSHGTAEDLKQLTNANVVYVHVNDAPVGVDIDAQVDNVREIPGATSVIDILTFMKALKTCGYDGPIVAEPFEKALSSFSTPEERLTVISNSLDSMMQLNL